MALLDRTLVKIRERSFPDLLDLAVVVARRRPVALGVAGLVGIAPCAAFNAWVAASTDRVALPLFLIFWEIPWATAPLTVVLGGLMFGQRPSAGKVARTLLRATPTLLLGQGLIRGFLMLTGVFGVLIPARLAFLNEVILMERGRGFRAIRRAGQLTESVGGELFGRALALFAAGSAFVLCFWVGTGAILGALIEGNLTWEQGGWSDLLGWRFLVPTWLAIAFFAVARFLTYLDRRIRLEGWEVEIRLRSVGSAMEADRRW